MTLIWDISVFNRFRNTMKQRTLYKGSASLHIGKGGWKLLIRAWRLARAWFHPCTRGGAAPTFAEALTGHADPTGLVKKDGYWCRAQTANGDGWWWSCCLFQKQTELRSTVLYIPSGRYDLCSGQMAELSNYAHILSQRRIRFRAQATRPWSGARGAFYRQIYKMRARRARARGTSHPATRPAAPSFSVTQFSHVPYFRDLRGHWSSMLNKQTNASVSRGINPRQGSQSEAIDALASRVGKTL